MSVNKPITEGCLPYSILNYGNGHSKYEQIDATDEEFRAKWVSLIGISRFSVSYNAEGKGILEVWRSK